MKKEQLEILERLIQTGICETPPKGWFTARDYAKAKKRTIQHCQKMLRRAVEKSPKEVLTKIFTVEIGKRIYPVAHYYVKTKKSK